MTPGQEPPEDVANQSDHSGPVWRTPLEEPEQAVREHAETGEILELPLGAEPNEGLPAVDFEAMQSWGVNRIVRAEVLRHLLVAPEWPVHAKGVRLRGARIIGTLDLESATLRCPLVLQDCYLELPVVLDYTTVSRLELVHCWVEGLGADGLIVTQELDLSQSKVTREVTLVGASITGLLKCSGAQITGNEDSGGALIADRITVGGGVLLNEGFSAARAVRLPGASITGLLSCSGARITATDEVGNALIADRITVDGGVFLNDGFLAAGAVRLPGAHIAGDLSCSGARITATDKVGNALIADRITVDGGVFLNDGFLAAGAVRLSDSTISGWLNCSGAQITVMDPDGDALTATSIAVVGDVLLNDGFTAAGAVQLSGGRIDGGLWLNAATLADPVALVAEGATVGQQLVWAPATTVTGLVNLERTHVHRLAEDWGNFGAYWPTQGRLRITDFSYDGFGGHRQATCEERLGWIRSQNQRPIATQPGSFASQPYEQLARVYRDAGQAFAARRIAIAQRQDERVYGSLNRAQYCSNWLQDVTIKYGYRPMRAISLLVMVYFWALVVFVGAQHQNGLMVPAMPYSPLYPAPIAAVCTAHYPCFSPNGYAIDLAFPLINTGQKDSWRPNAAAPWGEYYLTGTWIFMGFGWISTTLITLAAASYTGLSRKV
jgi:hypothetical protein